ncbi:MAG: hypothetical protein ACYDHX_10985 [Methanothrix sp.]
MNPKIAVSILMLLALSWPSVGTDYFYLGNGIRDQVINLDAGAKLPGQNYQFTRSGFVTPSMPQPMALSPNMMITQAKNLMDEAGSARDESVSARDEAKAMNDEAKALLEKIAAKEQNIQSLLTNAEAGAEASATKAAQAGGFFNKTDEAYKKTLALSTEVEGNVSQMKSMLEEARDYVDASAQSAGQASNSQNRTYLLHNETAVIFSKSSAVYNNMTLLAKEIQANSDNIRTWMNEKTP